MSSFDAPRCSNSRSKIGICLIMLSEKVQYLISDLKVVSFPIINISFSLSWIGPMYTYLHSTSIDCMVSFKWLTVKQFPCLIQTGQRYIGWSKSSCQRKMCGFLWTGTEVHSTTSYFLHLPQAVLRRSVQVTPHLVLIFSLVSLAFFIVLSLSSNYMK